MQTCRQGDRHAGKQTSKLTARKPAGQCRVKIYEMDVNCLYSFVTFSLFCKRLVYWILT